MNISKFATLIAFALLCLGIPAIANAQWTLSGYTLQPNTWYKNGTGEWYGGIVAGSDGYVSAGCAHTSEASTALVYATFLTDLTWSGSGNPANPANVSATGVLTGHNNNGANALAGSNWTCDDVGEGNVGDDTNTANPYNKSVTSSTVQLWAQTLSIYAKAQCNAPANANNVTASDATVNFTLH